MRIERADRRPHAPPWAVALVIAYFSLVGVRAWTERATGMYAPFTCTFRSITGYPCPTCGSTRMVVALAHGDLRQAIGHNPLMFAVAFLLSAHVGVRFFLRRRIVWITSGRSRRTVTAGILLAVFVNWLYLLASS